MKNYMYLYKFNLHFTKIQSFVNIEKGLESK